MEAEEKEKEEEEEEEEFSGTLLTASSLDNKLDSEAEGEKPSSTETRTQGGHFPRANIQNA